MNPCVAILPRTDTAYQLMAELIMHCRENIIFYAFCSRYRQVISSKIANPIGGNQVTTQQRDRTNQ